MGGKFTSLLTKAVNIFPTHEIIRNKATPRDLGKIGGIKY